MGSSSSKTSAAAASAGAGAGAVVRKNRSMEGTRGVLSSSCLGRCRSHNNYNNHHVLAQVVSKEENRTITLDDEQEQDSHQVLKRQQQSCRRNDGNHHDNDNDNDNDDVKVDYKISSLEDDQSPSTQSRSCFRLIPANLSFRLSRAASFTSSSPPSPSPTPFPLFSNSTTSTTVLATPPNAQPAIPSCDHSVITNQGCELPPPSATVAAHHSPASQYLHLFSSDSTALRLDRATSSTLSPCPHNDNIVSNHYDHAPIVNTDNTAMILPHHTSSNHHTDTTFIHSTRVNTRIGARQPVERSVRFSRTLSVGRLRDRVLRRSSLTDGLFGHLQHNRDMGNSSQDDGRQVSDGNPDISPPSPTHPLPRLSNSNNSQDDELDTSRPRDVRYHDIMQHRTDFLERRRRIRSQVRALQRLGSRFENLSGHERSCILAGQHRSGHCTCQMSSRARNPNNDTSARASISRIVMLAEALFEVLDEIHQQSVVLSSRPSVSSLGSIPAPTEVVESMPVKIYTRLQKHQHEDVTQCYICLVEYEEGDSMRILPCHHDFHRTCIDKWLKEIHRVCPLCRGDVCRSRSLPSEN